MIKIASYNLENLFARPTAMSFTPDTPQGREAIEDHAVLNTIIEHAQYSDQDKAKLVELSHKYKWHYKNPPKNALVQLQKLRGPLFRQSQSSGELTVVAKGRKSWVGWFELRKDDVRWEATLNTGQIIVDNKPDILIAVEVENRPTLDRFNNQVLKSKFGFEYPHFMAIDGNDPRGIDLGIMSKFPIIEIRSHVDDVNPEGNKIFSRDCPEYDLLLPDGSVLVVIPNHFKSKRNGNDQESENRRIAQGRRAHEIAFNALQRSPYVLIAGDLNDTPNSATLAELLKNGFEDVQSHPSYPADRPGTFGTGTAGNKIDYLIMSPALRQKLQHTGIERRGTYHPNIWEPLPTVTSSVENASDHHLIWGEFDL
ncbi:MAG TPA: endonuclease/exonuclease/phosphatase family protein [Saprospiraceae bacterium]|nr:endonuclease/exonuclease/phosphatase family protein [Saprospiraceae bacterium]